jgi:3-deoxy-manno-octulosonate cytidylyltransferase (CMP-KDO synthetase)
MRVLGVIPARLGSTRIPNKPLQLLAGEPLVTRVIDRVRKLGLVDELVVATDSTMVCRIVELAGARAVLTRESHSSGTDRVAEAASRPEYAGCDVVANIQGDEPFLPGAALAGALDRIAQGDEVGTAAAPLSAEQAGDPDRVKVVADAQGHALYFSRAAIPFRRERTPPPRDLYWQHVGVYAYRREALDRWTRLPPVPAEEAERLEQLRALHYGMRVGVAQLAEPAQPGVDTPEDLRRAEAHWLAQREDR